METKLNVVVIADSKVFLSPRSQRCRHSRDIAEALRSLHGLDFHGYFDSLQFFLPSKSLRNLSLPPTPGALPTEREEDNGVSEKPCLAASQNEAGYNARDSGKRTKIPAELVHVVVTSRPYTRS